MRYGCEAHVCDAYRLASQELATFLHKLGNDWDEERVKQVYNSIEKNSDGNVDFSSFYAWYSQEMQSSADGDDSIQVCAPTLSTYEQWGKNHVCPPDVLSCKHVHIFEHARRQETES